MFCTFKCLVSRKPSARPRRVNLALTMPARGACNFPRRRVRARRGESLALDTELRRDRASSIAASFAVLYGHCFSNFKRTAQNPHAEKEPRAVTINSFTKINSASTQMPFSLHHNSWEEKRKHNPD